MGSELSFVLSNFGDMMGDFCEELGGIGEELLQLTTSSLDWNDELVNSIQAKLHSIKGISSQLGFVRLGKSVHQAEDKIVAFRKNGQLPSSEVLLKLSDFADFFLNFIKGIQSGAAHEMIETSMERAIKSMNFESSAQLTAEIIPITKDKVDQSKALPKPGPSANGAGDLALAQKDFDAVFAGISESLNSLRSLANSDASKVLQPRLESSLFSLVQARVTPVKGLTARLKKLTRELAVTLGKKVDLEIQGETEAMDRLLVTSLGEIMVHLLRNAMDHGLETPTERIAAGKSDTSKLTLQFSNKGDRNSISIGDDGRGIDPDKVAAKAMASGLITQADVERMTRYEKQELIFASGFSMKEAASEISGRGVGMDAVMREVQKLGGKLVIDSNIGTGTTFLMEFPSPYQIEPAVSFLVGNQNFTLSASVLRGIVLETDGVLHESGTFNIPGLENTFLNIHLGEIMPKATDQKRPLLLLHLVGSDVCMQVDEITGVGRMLIYRHTRTEDLPTYINGIGFNQNGVPHFGLDCTELERNLNKYLGLSEGETDMFSIEPLPESGITKQQILDALESPELIGSIKEILSSLTSTSDVKEKVIQVISIDITAFKDAIQDIEDPTELQYMVAIQYANLKSKWITLNIQMQYATVADKEPDAYAMYMASILSVIVGTVESLASPNAVECITQALAQPLNKN
ncbi:MAG: Hpt domain-containing protein [Bdellovibrio sp.]|nr:Hpt domain-containing protein [Bdellovibrio sp.]